MTPADVAGLWLVLATAVLGLALCYAMGKLVDWCVVRRGKHRRV